MKYAHQLLLIVCFLLLSACKEEVKLSIPEDQLISVLVDVHIAEAALQDLDRTRTDSLGIIYYQQIFEIHGINEEAFKDNVLLLRQHPSISKDIYERVLEELSKEELNNKKRKNKKKEKDKTEVRDSSARAKK